MLVAGARPVLHHRAADGPAVGVYTADGALLGLFVDEKTAHVFAHERCLLPHTRLPLNVEDTQRRTTRQIWPWACEKIVWIEAARFRSCPELPE